MSVNPVHQRTRTCEDVKRTGVEFAGGRRDDLFAGSLPKWTGRRIESFQGVNTLRSDCCPMSLDVTSAFLYASVSRDKYINQTPR